MKRVRWIQKTHLFRADEYICSRCGAVCARPYKACPRCGSVMGRTKYDPSWVDEMEGMSALLDSDW
jgi:RNA polymerase subunit RPABC4/transcription elongation factor Spt4